MIFLETINDVSTFTEEDYDVEKLNISSSKDKMMPSIICPPVLDLKPLPSHLMYAYLGEGETLHLIIANNISKLQEEKLVEKLKIHKTGNRMDFSRHKRN